MAADPGKEVLLQAKEERKCSLQVREVVYSVCDNRRAVLVFLRGGVEIRVAAVLPFYTLTKITSVKFISTTTRKRRRHSQCQLLFAYIWLYSHTPS